MFYSYLTFGSWSDCTGCKTTNAVGVIGAFVYGLATDPAAIPTSSTATYTGSIRGQYVDAAGVVSERTRANLSSTADFTARTVSFATTGSITSSGTNAFVTNNGLNMTGNLSYSAGSNQFTGAVTATGLSGTATGKFFGPAAQEIGGVFSLQGSAGNHDGLFIGK